MNAPPDRAHIASFVAAAQFEYGVMTIQYGFALGVSEGCTLSGRYGIVESPAGVVVASHSAGMMQYARAVEREKPVGVVPAGCTVNSKSHPAPLATRAGATLEREMFDAPVTVNC